MVRSADNRLINKVFWKRPEEKRKIWKDEVAEDLKRMGVQQCEIGAQDRQNVVIVQSHMQVAIAYYNVLYYALSSKNSLAMYSFYLFL